MPRGLDDQRPLEAHLCLPCRTKCAQTHHGILPKGECNNRTATLEAEAIAQARLIAKLNKESVKGHSSTTGITADIQWETQYTDSAGRVRRPDVMVYDHTQANAKPELIEAWRIGRARLAQLPDLAQLAVLAQPIDFA
jgi:hypothetical protein